jgi:hypothetical protein
MDEAVKRLLDAQEPDIGELARRLIALIDDLYPDAVVSVDGGDIGFGSGAGYKGLVFVVAPHAQHVTLGLARGVDLPDPAGLMEGRGKVHRHVKIRQESDLERAELRALMTAAVDSR